MRKKLSGTVPMVAITVAVSAAILTPISPAAAQAPSPGASPGTPVAAPKTAWGEPDLQGIWTDETDTPLQRPAKYANQEFFTEAQRAELDKARSEVPRSGAGARSAGPSGTSPAPTTTCSCPSSAPARARR